MDNKKVVVDYDPVESQSEVVNIDKENHSFEKGHCWTRNRILIALGVAVCIALAVGLGVGLGMKNKKATIALDIPFLKPPVVSASPSGLKGSRRMLERDTPVRKLLQTFTTAEATAVAKSRMFQAGPLVYSTRLGSVDERLQEFKTRALESPKVCLSKTALKFEPSLPNNEAFPMYFSCKEEMSSSLSVYFGKSDNKYYVAELQKSSGSNIPSIAVLASVDSEGNKVDVWQIILDESTSPKSASVSHIRADRTENTISVITAASSTGTGVGCGMKLSSTSSALWLYGYPSDVVASTCPTDVTVNDYKNSVAAGDWKEYCVDPSSLTDKSGACNTLKSNFPLSSFSYGEIVSSGFGAIAYTLPYLHAHNADWPGGFQRNRHSLQVSG